ncbi:hypothetical protein, partial [Rhodoblastus sp.]|uniref:hypothetical protein n=1 Tax=Rhodoblastus sp. TaxID=1962975 RepID=UPI003F984650
FLSTLRRYKNAMEKNKTSHSKGLKLLSYLDRHKLHSGIGLMRLGEAVSLGSRMYWPCRKQEHRRCNK